jgi:hypothetical protein
MQSFFDLTWNSPYGMDEHDEYLASLTEREREELHEESTPLAQALFSALRTYTDAHPTTMGACIHALRAMAYSLERQVDEQECDA